MSAPERYNRLTLVQRDVGRTGDGHIKSEWLCDCGEAFECAYSRVKNGTTTSCGCYGREISQAAATRHGGRNTAEYSSWMAMRRRCENVTDKDYPRYGGAGVRVCAEWTADFVAFREHVGPRPQGTTLDRIDSRLGYQPGNVRWATPTEQARNRRGAFVWSIKGKTFESITEAAAHFNVSEHSISRWVNGAFDKRRGTSTPPRSDCTVQARYV